MLVLRWQLSPLQAQWGGGSIIPLASYPLYNKLGLGWTYTLLASVLIALGGIIQILYFYF